MSLVLLSNWNKTHSGSVMRVSDCDTPNNDTGEDPSLFLLIAQHSEKGGEFLQAVCDMGLVLLIADLGI